MKKLIYLLTDNKLDSFAISELVAQELGLNESNKNYETNVFTVDGLTYCKIMFDHENKKGWNNPTNMSDSNKNKIKIKIAKIPEFESVIYED